MVDLRIGKHYQMIRKIGSGAFGEIFEGNKRWLKLFRQKHYHQRVSGDQDGKKDIRLKLDV